MVRHLADAPERLQQRAIRVRASVVEARQGLVVGAVRVFTDGRAQSAVCEHAVRGPRGAVRVHAALVAVRERAPLG